MEEYREITHDDIFGKWTHCVRLMGLLGVGLVSGCAGLMMNMAITTAASDHPCPKAGISVVDDLTRPGQSRATYLLDVCGRRRVYQEKREEEPGPVFRDVTTTFWKNYKRDSR